MPECESASVPFIYLADELEMNTNQLAVSLELDRGWHGVGGGTVFFRIYVHGQHALHLYLPRKGNVNYLGTQV